MTLPVEINPNMMEVASGGDTISRSLRFRASATTYLTRTFGSGSPTTWTFSAWVKRGTLSSRQTLFSCFNTANTQGFAIEFDASNCFAVWNSNTSSSVPALVTTQVFRDPSAWYHIVFCVNTTLATAADRYQLYVNGQRVTSFSSATYPTQNSSLVRFNSTFAHGIGLLAGPNTQPFDGHLAAVNFINAQAFDASYFGQTDATTGVWKPKKYTGAYTGTSFYLGFSNTTSVTTLGNDSSGLGNNWTPTNHSLTAGVTYDSMIDVPNIYDDNGNGRGNYCVLNALDDNANMTPSAANLSWANAGATQYSTRSTMFFPSSDKWYAEFTISSSAAIIGIANQSAPVQGFTGLNGVFVITTAIYNNSGSATQSGLASFAANDVIAVAYDADSNTVQFYRNNTAFGTALTPSASGPFCFIVGANGAACTINANFGQRPFTYAVPSGYKALNTQNLPSPTIVKGNAWMDVTAYSGTGGQPQTITNAGAFQPDLIWIKNRSTAGYGNSLQDSLRGFTTGKKLRSDATSVEGDATFSPDTSGYVSAVQSNGFQLSFATGGDARQTHNSNDTYVAWQWKKGATPGFDIVTYTGNGVNARQMSHSLGVAPSMIIVKGRSNTYSWYTYHASLGPTKSLYLNLTNTPVTGGQWFNSSPTSTFFYLGGTGNEVNENGQTYVAYLFADVEGFSKFGSYTGNGSADGPFVYCGFRPRFILFKNTSSVQNWFIYDTARNPSNLTTQLIRTNTNDAETTGTTDVHDILSNGFKVRGTGTSNNGNGNTIIYAAFAENPFKYALAR